MESRVEMFLDDFDGMLEAHSEFKDELDLDDIDTRTLWVEIEDLLKPLRRRAAVLRRTGTASEDDMDHLESTLENVNELLAELGGMI